MKLTIGESELGCMQTVVPAFPARRVLSLHQNRPTPLRVSRVTPRHRSLICVISCVCHSMLYTLQDRPGCCSEGLVGVVRRVRAAHSCPYEWCKGSSMPCDAAVYDTPPLLPSSVNFCDQCAAAGHMARLRAARLSQALPYDQRQQGMCRCIGAHI